MNTLALVLARAGSKGVPGKNVKILGDKPLIAYTIEAALKSRGVDKVVVSTDCPQIAEIAKRHGAEVPFLRPAHLADDKATSLATMKHALLWLEQNQSYHPDAVLLLQPTSPFRQSWQIDESLEIFQESKKDSIIGVQEVNDKHPMWAVQDSTDLTWYIQGQRPNRRQDLPKAYTLNGAIYISKADYFRAARDPMPAYNEKDAVIYPMNAVTSLDINEPIDFALAKTLLNEQDMKTWTAKNSTASRM